VSAQLLALLGISVIAAAMVAWSIYGLVRTVRELRRDLDPQIRIGLRATLAILIVRLVLALIVAGLLVWTVLNT
jgi:hypothetical protein